MRVTVNGEEREIKSERVDSLLTELDYEGAHFAIAVNYDVVPKSRWADTALKAGDEIEIITPRQGGRCGDAKVKRAAVTTNSAVIARLDRATQYAAASRFNRRLPGVLGPRLRGDDELWL